MQSELFFHDFQKKHAKNVCFMSFRTKIFNILCDIVSILYVWCQKPGEKSVFGQKSTRNRKKTHQSMLEIDIDGCRVGLGRLRER